MDFALWTRAVGQVIEVEFKIKLSVRSVSWVNRIGSSKP